VVNTAKLPRPRGQHGRLVELAPGAIAAGRSEHRRARLRRARRDGLQGLSIGADTVIGAGSVVVAAIEPGVVAFGTPCRTVRPRVHDEAYL
jgi:hypothetical protein